MTALTDANLHEWRALCVGPDGADLRAVILTERRSVVAVLDELARMRAVVDAARRLVGCPLQDRKVALAMLCKAVTEMDDRKACGDNCTQWERDANAGLPVYLGRRTQKEWVPIAAASYARTGNLPDD